MNKSYKNYKDNKNKEMDVSLCIVNYKTDKELKKCVESVNKFTKGVSYEVIVIDNSEDNRWYSGGNNLEVEQARGGYVLFLNPDCWLENDAIAELVNFMDKHPKAGAVEPRQVYENGEIAPTGSLLPKWWIDSVEMTGLWRWFGRLGAPAVRSPLSWSTSTRRGVATAGFGRASGFLQGKNPGLSEGDWGISAEMLRYRMVGKDRGKNWQTDVISGAAMMVRREVLDRIGGFDERLKLYYTDVDLCRRISRAGREIWHAGEIWLGHKTRGSTSKLPWDRLNLIYAADGREYYRKWGEKIGGEILYWAMRGNEMLIKANRAVSRYHFFDTLGQEPSLTSSSPPGWSKSKVLSGSSSIVSKMTSSGQPALIELTAIVICRSKRDRRFKQALASVGFADEVLVVERREISDWAAVRNDAMERAKGEWVMFVDSDEEIGEELKKEIRRITDKSYKDYKNYNIGGAYFRRRDRFLGKWLRHGETARVRFLRLARKGAGRWERPVHEVWKVGGKTVTLMNPIRHYSHQSLDEMVEKLDRYSGMEAEYRLGSGAPAVRSPLPWLTATRRGVATAGFGRASGFSQGKNPGPSEKFGEMRIAGEMILYPIGKFIVNYFFRLGFLDGMEGLIHAFLMSGHPFLTRAKLLERYEYTNSYE